MYIVIELQTNDEGQVGTLVNSYETKTDADSKYFQILATAAKSNFACHAATIINEEGYPIRCEAFRH